MSNKTILLLFILIVRCLLLPIIISSILVYDYSKEIGTVKSSRLFSLLTLLVRIAFTFDFKSTNSIEMHSRTPLDRNLNQLKIIDEN